MMGFVDHGEMTETYPVSDLHSYPGGPAAWFRAMSAKYTREGNRQVLKPAARGEGKARGGQSTTGAPKNDGDGRSARTGQVPGVPNETEKRYRDEFLVPRILAGEISECVFEGKTYVLADGPKREDKCEYTPDWYCQLFDGTIECHEVKGPHVWGDSRVKFKWAKDKFRDVKWVWAQWRDGKWHIRGKS